MFYMELFKSVKIGFHSTVFNHLQLKHLERQLKETEEQRSHWQERARCSESETWELQLYLEARDGNIKELNTECDSLREDKLKLIK